MQPKRKHPRLKHYDYSTIGAYFVTICTYNRRQILSRIVGRGLAPAERDHPIPCGGDTLLEIVPRLTEYGKIAEEQLWMLESRFPTVKIDQYVIMPDHIHLLLILKDFMSLEDRCKQAAGASPRPTSTGEVTDPQHPLPNLIRVIGTYKSLTTRACKNYRPIDKLFQSSFYEHVIRGPQDYEEMIRYIQNNPAKWYYDRMTDI